MIIQNESKDFSLRKFTPEDLEEVIHINRSCLPENYIPSFFLSIYKGYPESFIVAERDGRVVGYIMCRIEKGFSSKFKIVKKGHVISIAVLPEHRRMGIGYALMKEAMKAMHKIYGAEECYLEVRVSNEAAINLYKKLGFEISGKIKGYYLDGEDAYIMSRKLPIEE